MFFHKHITVFTSLSPHGILLWMCYFWSLYFYTSHNAINKVELLEIQREQNLLSPDSLLPAHCLPETIIWKNVVQYPSLLFWYICSKITADGDCSHEIKRRLLLGKKVMTNLDSILKSRDIILPTKIRLVKAMVSTVVMYGCESWTIKKAEHRRIEAFELWCWWRLFRVPWTARRSS